MADSKRKAPKLRFPGFNDDWEQRKFEEVFDFSISTNSFSRAQLNFEEGIVKSVHYGDILVNYNAILDAEKDKIPFITDGTLVQHKNNLLKDCDIIFADAAEDETVGKAVEVNGIQDSFLVSGLHTIVARPKQEVAPYFYGYYINSNSYHKQLLKLMQGTKVSSISKTNLKKTVVFFPNDLKEQENIGRVFKQLDDLITLHQRKLSDVQKLKSGLLQKIFPKNGEKVPEIRFPEFSDDWEQRKLDNVIKKLSGGASIEPGDYQSDGVRTIPKGAINDSGVAILSGSKFISKDFFKKNFTSHVSTNDLVTSLRDLVPSAPNLGRVVRIVGIEEEFLMPQGVYKIELFKNMNQDFLISFSNSDQYRKIISQEKNGSTQVHIRNREFLNIKISLPSFEEQQRIGAFFKQLNDLITLHQRKLEHLQQQKKALLQQMFI